MSSAQPARHLLVFSYVEHRIKDGKIVAHGGFVREMDTWAKVFDRVTVATLSSPTPPKSDDIPYTQPNITIAYLDTPKRITGLIGRLRMFASVPRWLLNARKLVENDTVIMARGPDYIGFLGVLITRFSKHPRFAKYAGQWTAYTGESPFYRFQRIVYRSRWFGGPVIVNAPPDPHRPHVAPLLNSSVSLAEWTRAGETIAERTFPPDQPRKLVLVGRVTAAKGIDVLLRAMRQLVDKGEKVTLDIVGDGAERPALETLMRELKLEEVVNFRGWLGRDDVFAFYAQAYCYVSSSRHQGLDKVILEAMTHGLPVIGTTTSVMPMLIEPPKCGLLVEPDQVDALVSAIHELLHDPARARQMGENSRAKSRTFLLDDMEKRYRTFLRDYLKLDV